MEALSREFRIGCPWELLYTNDLVLMAETLEDLKKKLTIWKDNIEVKGLWANVIKTKLACSKHNLSVKSDPIKWWCSICCKGVGINSIFCQSCNHWVQKRCSKIKGRLKADPSFKCNACTNNISTISQDNPEVIIGNDKFEEVYSFSYLGDSISQSGSCFEATTEREWPGRISTVCFQYWQIVASHWKLVDMHTMPVFVVSCCMLVKLVLLK